MVCPHRTHFGNLTVGGVSVVGGTRKETDTTASESLQVSILKLQKMTSISVIGQSLSLDYRTDFKST